MNRAVIAAISTAVFNRLNIERPFRRLRRHGKMRRRAEVQSPWSSATSSARRPSAQPRRSASAGMRLPPARCSSVSASRPSPQATVRAPPSMATISPGVPSPHELASPALDGLAAEDAARARQRVEGAHAAFDRRGGLAPVDRRFGLVDLGGVGHAVLGLRPPTSGDLASAPSARDQDRAERGQSAPCSVARRCRRRRCRASREQHVAGVEAGVHLHDRDAGLASPASIARWIGAAPRQRGSSDAWMFRQPWRGSASSHGGRMRP